MLLVLAHGETPERLLAALTSALGSRASVQAEPTTWGALVLADGPSARSDRWLVAGRPQRDPWGIPTGDLPLGDAVAEYERYGPSALHLGSGPFVVAELQGGSLLRVPNGIVPVFRGLGPRGPVLGTSRHAVALLARDVHEVAPSEMAGPSGAAPIPDASGAERLPLLRWDWLEAEVEQHAQRAGPLAPAGVVIGPDGPDEADSWLRRTAAGDILFLPPLREFAQRYDTLRRVVAPRMWWRARLGHSWLFAPALERPARDTVVLMAGEGA
jgi:hypothetical protein